MRRPALSRLPSLALGVCAWIGLALLAVASTTLDPTAGYPGFAAIVPTLAVVLAICGSDQRRGPGSLLALAPLRALGRISFSLYLYHWPVLLLAAIAVGHLSGIERQGLVGLALLVAAR